MRQKRKGEITVFYNDKKRSLSESIVDIILTWNQFIWSVGQALSQAFLLGLRSYSILHFFVTLSEVSISTYLYKVFSPTAGIREEIQANINLPDNVAITN
jgi:hypothetical protein